MRSLEGKPRNGKRISRTGPVNMVEQENIQRLPRRHDEPAIESPLDLERFGNGGDDGINGQIQQIADRHPDSLRTGNKTVGRQVHLW